MEYYHDLVTVKSWNELQKLVKKVDFILIGGWAVFLYTKALKSKDIDIIVNFDQLPVLQKHYSLYKNDRLRKYEARNEEVEIDIYLPHFSRIGIPVEDLMKRSTRLEGFKLLNIDYLFVLKAYSLAVRGRSIKGRKDFLDLIALISSAKCDFNQINKIVKKYKLTSEISVLKDFFNENFDAPELNINRHQFSKLKKNFLSTSPAGGVS